MLGLSDEQCERGDVGDVGAGMGGGVFVGADCALHGHCRGSVCVALASVGTNISLPVLHVLARARSACLGFRV